MPRLITTNATEQADVRAFFNDIAIRYGEAHGDAEGLLHYRLSIIKPLLQPSTNGILLEIGCGTGMHTIALAQDFEHCIGIDLSETMIDAAENALALSGKDNVEFHSDTAERLSSVADNSIDIALCVGTLEHVMDKPVALGQVYRVLKPGGAFICLTPNGQYCWYTTIAPTFGYATKHLSSDHFLGHYEMHSLLKTAGLCREASGHWSFIPKGDMPMWAAVALSGLDLLGRCIYPQYVRGGLYFRAIKSI